MSIRQLNTEKKLFRCLKCGRQFRTDRCHRTCARCKKAMFRYREGARTVYVPSFSMEGVEDDFSIGNTVEVQV